MEARMPDATDCPADEVLDNEPMDEARTAAFRRQLDRATDMSVADAARAHLKAERKRLAVGKLSRSKAATVVPIAAPPAGIPFPGGYVNPVSDGQVAVAVDAGNGVRTLGGSNYQAFTETLLDTVLATLRVTPAEGAKRVAAAAAALAAFKPTNEVEAMLAGQAVALHHGAMECLRRAMLPDQHPDTASKLRKDGANLARGMTDMLDALDRRRGKGPQVVRVERVVVHEGGQAIVGNVQPVAVPKAGVGDEVEIGEQPCG
jgi:hypothetical protein